MLDRNIGNFRLTAFLEDVICFSYDLNPAYTIEVREELRIIKDDAVLFSEPLGCCVSCAFDSIETRINVYEQVMSAELKPKPKSKWARNDI